MLSRLVAKASQLLGIKTTYLAECWMHVRTKFDGGKVINRSQSGSFGYRSMGAGLRQNLGANWGPQVWKNVTTTSPNKYLVTRQKILLRERRRIGKERELRQPKKVDAGVNILQQRAQLQLGVLTADTMMALRLRNFTMTSLQNIWRN